MHRGQFTISAMCRVLKVSTSGYYAWRSRPESERIRSDRRLLVKIRAAHKRSKKRYGSPRIHAELKAEGERCGRKRVARLMQEDGLRARQARKFKATTDSKHEMPVAKNLLARNFDAKRPNAVWAADITYVWTREGWLYLAVVLDLFSRRVVGWSLRPYLQRSLVLEALGQSLRERRPGAGLVHHSDRGSQYASHDYQRLLAGAGIACSMSRKGDCWDNAPVESFFSTLKRELIHGREFRTRAEARSEIFEYIEVWYNRKRRHSSLGYLSPVQYEERWTEQQTAALAA